MERRASRETTTRNVIVERAVSQAIARIDYFLSDGELSLPEAKYRRACEDLLEKQSPSAKVAAMFFIFYWLEDKSWDRDRLPAGVRGQYGDKRLSEALSRHHITLHENIISFAENLTFHPI
jgi:hypothetical protein